MPEAPFIVDPGGAEAQARKAELRDEFLKRRLVIPQDLKDTTQWKVNNFLRSLLGEMEPMVIGLYFPIREEIDMRRLAEELWENGDTLALPRVVEKEHPLSFNIWDKHTEMSIDAEGVPCALGEEIWPSTLVIPCLGYNKQGYRLGYGGGYYDRTLRQAKQPLVTIGVCYTELEVKDYPVQRHDEPLDYIVTGKEVINCQR